MTKQKIILGSTLCTLLTISSIVKGEAVPLKAGQSSPYDGILISPEAAAIIMAEKRALPDLIDVEVKKEREQQEAKCKFRLDQQEISSQQSAAAANAQVKDLLNSNSALSKQLADAQSSIKWTPAYVTGAAILGLATGVLTSIIVIKTTR